MSALPAGACFVSEGTLGRTQAGDDAQVLGRMRLWLERAVIGLNLCPFAKAVYAKQQVHFAVCRATDAEQILESLRAELLALQASDPGVRDTSLLILPEALADFAEFNDFLVRADRLLRKSRLDEEFQIASFHPDYQFADAGPHDISNYTNRAPYPTLHLLREASIDKAVQAFPDAAEIYEKNVATLEQLGHAGWAALGLGASLGTPPQAAS